MGKFSLVRKWFLKTFKDFDMANAKKEISDAVFAEIAAASASDESKTFGEDKTSIVAMDEQKMAG